MKKTVIGMALIGLVLLGGAQAADDWRKQGSDAVKMNNLIKVIPGTSDVMFQMGERYKNLYWAARQGKWEFAEYQMEEMQGLIKTLMITRPERRATAQEFLERGFAGMAEAIEHRNWSGFESAFLGMRSECMACHSKNDHAFITLNRTPARGSSPVLD